MLWRVLAGRDLPAIHIHGSKIGRNCGHFPSRGSRDNCCTTPLPSGSGNIDADPLFADVENENYRLTEFSPCINAGDNSVISWQLDLDNNLRIYDGIVDIGCYEWQGTESDNYQISNLNFNNYPNPFNPSTTISFNITAKNVKDAKIEIYNIKGQRVRTFSNLQINKSPNQQIIWNGTDENGKQIASGIYLYKLQIDKNYKIKRMLLMK